jgi:crossover junction endodeoxyribonuclease RuvC
MGAGAKASRDKRGSGAPAPLIIGIDPGLASVGWGVIEVGPGGRLAHIDHGCISTDKAEAIGDRLLVIFSRIVELIGAHNPVSASMESLYFWKNVTSALPVAEAKGVIHLAFSQAGVELVEYSPTAIKQAVSGSTRAEKAQVQDMVRIILGLASIPKPDHAADALAAAICHANQSGPLSGGSLCPSTASRKSGSRSAPRRTSSSEE